MGFNLIELIQVVASGSFLGIPNRAEHSATKCQQRVISQQSSHPQTHISTAGNANCGQKRWITP